MLKVPGSTELVVWNVQFVFVDQTLSNVQGTQEICGYVSKHWAAVFNEVISHWYQDIVTDQLWSKEVMKVIWFILKGVMRRWKTLTEDFQQWTWITKDWGGFQIRGTESVNLSPPYRTRPSCVGLNIQTDLGCIDEKIPTSLEEEVIFFNTPVK